jgi:hypothetical protein
MCVCDVCREADRLGVCDVYREADRLCMRVVCFVTVDSVYIVTSPVSAFHQQRAEKQLRQPT